MKIQNDAQSEIYIQLYAPCSDTYSEQQADELFDELSQDIEKV